MDCMEYNSVESHHHLLTVIQAEAGVSFIPLDDFSSVDTVANSLVQISSSKESRQSQKQVRGDQELTYQVATDNFEEKEDSCYKNSTRATTIAWSAITAVLESLAITKGGVKKMFYLITAVMLLLGSVGCAVRLQPII